MPIKLFEESTLDNKTSRYHSTQRVLLYEKKIFQLENFSLRSANFVRNPRLN